MPAPATAVPSRSSRSGSGIPALGDIDWGTHFCQFYRTQQDLVDTLVPYFEAGLRNNEFCMWVTSDPLDADAAKAAMRQAMPEFDDCLARGQIEIWDYRDWYIPDGYLDYQRVFRRWVDKEKQSQDGGFAGLRLTGNTFWLERGGWDDFVQYESEVNRNFGKHRIIGLCTYSLDACSGPDVIDVIRNHEFALARHEGRWELMETSSLKQAKAQLKALNDDLETRVAERTRELERAVRGRDQFLAMLAHELRNPLAPILNGLHVLGAPGVAPADAEQTRRVLHRQATHMSRMVDDLLEVSRVTAGKVQLRKQRVDLVDLVRAAAADNRGVLASTGHTLRLTLPPGPLWLTGDSTRLSQVISNLLNNAAKFSDGGTVVDLEVRPEPGGAEACVVVRDNGIGLDAAMVARLFEPFTQADRSLDRSRGGLGLGLALVKGLVSLHGGTVSAASDGHGLGSTFTVRLPLDAAPAATPDGPEAEAPLAAGARRILVVEDNVDSAHVMRLLLRLGGHQVWLAHSGPDGVAAARQHKPDLVLCDIGLPGMSGYDVARTLAADPALAPTRLVAITGYGQEEDVRLAHDAGFCAHLTKPVDPRRLEAVIAEVTTRG